MKKIDENQMCLPIDLQNHKGECYVVCAILPRQNLTDPFLLDSLAYRFGVAEVNKRKPEEQDILVRPLHYNISDSRIELVSVNDFVETFDGKKLIENKLKFIFHMSRCGSTLVTQMLSTSNRFFVVSEPPIIIKLLDPNFVLPNKQDKMRLLKAIICSIELCKNINTEFTFIKFRSWNTLYIDEIIELFPNVQWMFVHRSGLEVLESVLRNPPGWLRSHITYAKYFAKFLELEESEILTINNEEYATRLLGVFCRKVNTQKRKNTFLLDYENVKRVFVASMKDKWNIILTQEEIKIMNDASRLYSKDPNKLKFFDPDGDIKRAKATKTQEDLVNKFVEVERVKLLNQ